MKKTLFLTYDYPPCSAPGAGMRSQKLARYLPEFGWDVMVMCREEGIFEGAEKQAVAEVIRIRTPIPPRVSYQIGAWMWARRILSRAGAVIRESGLDLIYASCPPFPHGLTAVRLAREAGIPGVVDFRDAWSLDPHLSGGALKQAAKRALCRWVYPGMERRLIESADAIIMNTPSMHREYVGILEGFEHRVHVVPNGFDEADFCRCGEVSRRELPLLLYCGRLTGIGGRSPEILLRAMRAVIDSGRRVELDIVGDDSAMLRRSIQRWGLEGSVRARAAVPHREAIRAMREADVLVVYQAPSRNGVTPVAGKTYEYLRSGRPILAIVPAGDNADLVRRYAGVHAVVSSADSDDVAAAILDLLDREVCTTNLAPNAEFVEKYTRRRIAEQVAGIFDAVVDGRA
ncbi:MAG TPA: glycosyltransferase family 4 protein [Bryobacteraceae bacterium]|nr:glycosyltransferase family 4 protein [Bryobacteraceae bacterium]